MPPRKDPNAHNNVDKSGVGAGSSNNTTNTSTPTTNTTTTSSTTTTTLPTTQTTTTPTTTSAATATANTTSTRSTSSSLAAAAAACVISGGASVAVAPANNSLASGETKQSASTCPVEVAAEQRTMAFQANSKLCRLVRKCPWMYDRNHNNYAKKHILDKSWVKIARECNDSVPSCKERWRNIRAAFARSINIYKTHSGPNRVKPYYLHKELSFLVKPMMEGRDKNDDTQDTLEGGTKDEYTEGEEEDDDHDIAEEAQPPDEDDDFNDDAADIKSAFEALNPDIALHSEAKFNKMLKNINNAILNSTRNQNHSRDFDASSANLFEPHADFSASDAENDFHYPDESMSQADVDRKSVNMLNHGSSLKRPMHLDAEAYESKRFKLSQITPSAAEADVRFLEALLPDMTLMNTRQKIVFKRKIYQTLEEVFENSNDFPNINTSVEQQSNMSQTMITATAPPQNPHATNSNIMNNPGGNQVKQTVLTVNSSTARSLINNIASLSEMDLQRVHGFLQSNFRTTPNNLNNNSSANMNTHNQNTAQRMTNGVAAAPSSAAARLMHSTPKITITKVTCPPPASLRNIAMNKPPSPSTATVSTTIHHTPGPIMTSNVHSTTSSTTANPSISSNTTGTSATTNPWTQLMPIAIKDEVEDVDID